MLSVFDLRDRINQQNANQRDSRRAAVRHRRMLVEELENRCVLAPGDFQPLAIEGTASDDVIVVEAVAGSTKRVLVTVNGVQTGPFQPLGAISIQGRQGNDSITISPDVFLPALIDGGPGLDTLFGGNGDDRFLSRDAEKDIIEGGLGRDEATTDSLDEISGIERVNPLIAAADNATQHVKVLVLNFDPLVPSEGNRHVYEIFGWNNPRDVATGYEADIERASGGAIDIDVIEWRDLNEIPAQADGYRPTPDEYVRNWRAGGGWHRGTADFRRIVAEQNLVPLIDSGVVDELWVVGMPYFEFY